MRKYKDFIIIKALNRHQDLGLRIVKNKLYVSILLYNASKKKYEHECGEVLIYDIDKFILALVSVMNGEYNNIFYNRKKGKQDVLMKLIHYNKAFKIKNTLKLSLYSCININSATHFDITISTDSARNLYRILNSVKLLQDVNI